MIFRDCLTSDCELMGIVEFNGRYYCTECFIEYCVMRESKVIWDAIKPYRKAIIQIKDQKHNDALTSPKNKLSWFDKLIFKLFLSWRGK